MHKKLQFGFGRDNGINECKSFPEKYISAEDTTFTIIIYFYSFQTWASHTLFEGYFKEFYEITFHIKRNIVANKCILKD